MFPREQLIVWQRTKKMKLKQKGLNLPPILSLEIEDDLKAWIVGVQCQGFPVSMDVILIKSNDLFHSRFGNTCQIGSLKHGWLNRFMEQHPIQCL
jgi:Tc5 transposase DNA-binding domain